MTIDHLEFSKKNYDDYMQQLNRECASDKALPEISYRYATEQKTQTVAQGFFSYLYSLGSLSYELIHWLAGLCIKSPTCAFLSKFTKERNELDKSGELWKYKRISVEVDGSLIDAMLIVRDSTAENGKWLLNSNANFDFYELHKPHTTCLKKIASSLDTNILVFNDPGVGASQGSYTCETIAKTHRAMLRFLEDKEKGIGANTIIDKGFCLGGNIQGEALKAYELQPEIKYVFIKDRSACDFSTAASSVNLCGIGKLLELCGWNMDTLSSSKKLNAHEILIHTADVGYRAREVFDPDLLIDDGILAKEETLGYHILKNQDLFSEKSYSKMVIGIPQGHCSPLAYYDTISVLCEKIKVALEEPLQTFKFSDSEGSDSEYGDVIFDGGDVFKDPALDGDDIWQ